MKLIAKAQSKPFCCKYLFLGLYHYDITRGDQERKRDINERINKYFSQSLENPIEDVATYAADLSTFLDMISSDKFNENDQLVANQLLLSSDNNQVNKEISDLLQPLNDLKMKKSDRSFVTKSEISSLLNQGSKKALISDYLDYSCDVESLSILKQQIKNKQNTKDLKKIVNYISTNLEYTPNKRRQNIKIKDFLDNDSKLNLKLVHGIADDILSQKSKNVADKLYSHKEAGVDIQASDLLSNDVKKSILRHVENKQNKIVDKQSLNSYLVQESKNDVFNQNIVKGKIL